MKKVSVALNCPSCAGPLTVREGDTHTVCPSCGSSLLLPSAVRRFVLPAAVSSTGVLRSVRKQLLEVDRRGTDQARVRKPVLYYLPFWHCAAQVNGYVLGVEPKFREQEIPIIDSEGQGTTGYAVARTRKIKTRTGSEAVEREIQISGSVNISGADLEPMGIPSLSADSQLSLKGIDIQRNGLPEGLEVLQDESEREGVFVDPVVPLAEARSQTEVYLRRLGSGVGHGLERRWEFTVVSGRRDALVYYPLWVTDFTSGGRTFQTIVDGRSGRILRGRFPDTKKDKKYLAFTAAVLWAGSLPILVDGILGGKMQYAAADGIRSCNTALLIGLAVMIWGTYKFLRILQDLQGKGSDSYV